MKDGRISWDGWCSVVVPDGWDLSEEDGLISITKQDGVGALQISFARRQRAGEPDAAETVDLTRSFATSQGWLVDQDIELTRLPGSYRSRFEAVEDDDGKYFWEVWHFLDRRRAACITYVCPDEVREKEALARAQIVDSFRWEPAPV
jgi:hypothetical protein